MRRMFLKYGGNPSRLFASLAALFFLMPTGARSAPAKTQSFSLESMSLEQLMNVEVQVASRHDEAWFTTSSAVFVLTRDDIRRSGYTTLPDLLRLVPGMDVAQIDSSDWAVSARGFNDQFASKLLVLMDDRVLYTPLFGGVMWDEQDTLLQDVERIEIVRGPGASQWGSNAMNGVINVVTLSAEETRGWYLSGAAGTEDKAAGAFRWGSSLGEKAWGRVWGKYDLKDASSLAGTDIEAGDKWQYRRGGFRMDGKGEGGSTWSLIGRGAEGKKDKQFMNLQPEYPYAFPVAETGRIRDYSIQGKWGSSKDRVFNIEVSSYGEWSRRDTRLFDGQWATGDLSFNGGWRGWKRGFLQSGCEIRSTRDELESGVYSFDPESKTDTRASAFIQAEQGLIGETLRLKGGVKFEGDQIEHWGAQPTLRLSCFPKDAWVFWASWARAHRLPTRSETDIIMNVGVLPGAPTTLLAIRGNDGMQAEVMDATEGGLRWQPSSAWVFSVVGFSNRYRDLRGVKRGDVEIRFDSWGTPYLWIPLESGNLGDATLYGGEAWAVWQVMSAWRIRPTVSHCLETFRFGPENALTPDVGKNPKWQVSVQSRWNLFHALELDATYRYVDPLPIVGIMAYQTVDTRIGWKPRPNLEISVTGRNLLEKRHAEFASSLIAMPNSDMVRAVSVRLAWSW